MPQSLPEYTVNELVELKKIFRVVVDPTAAAPIFLLMPLQSV